MAVLPDEVTFAQAAALPVAGVTALLALDIGGNPIARRVLVTGASGGVGRFAVQLAHIGGAHVTAVSASPERARGLTDLGADEVIHELTPEGPELRRHRRGRRRARRWAPRSSASRPTARSSPSPTATPARTSSTPRARCSAARPGARIYGLLVFPELAKRRGATGMLDRLAGAASRPGASTRTSISRRAGASPATPSEALLDRRIAGKAILHVD